MRIYKVVTIICLHLLFALVCGAFVAALACNEYVIAALCPAAYSVLRALWWADVEMEGVKHMRFEIIEYKRNEEGKKVILTTYLVEQFDLSRTIDRLNADVRSGRICDFDIASV